MPSRPGAWLEGRLVVELGGRLAVGACGTLLAQAGATVVFVEPRSGQDAAGKFMDRALFAAGKRSLAVDLDDAADKALVDGLTGRADIVLTSSDWPFLGRPGNFDIPDDVTVCNFTALGRSHPLSGLTESQVQALTGVAFSSGFADGGPTALRVPVLEYSAAVFAAAACTAALTAMRATGQAQQIEVTLFNCAIHLLAAFLPPVFHGEEPGRYGNGHPLASPWNAYPCRDGWMLFCSASDAQWQKFCEVIGWPELVGDTRFKRIADRAQHRAAVDAIVADWSRQLETRAAIEQLAAAGLAGGDIVALGRLPEEPNVRHRRAIVSAVDPEAGETVQLPAQPVITTLSDRTAEPRIPRRDADRDWLKAATFAPLAVPGRPKGPPALPLAGVRVIEIGQFTTAPLSSRHLSMYGAEIIKIEPLEGDAARAWAPLIDGTSVFFSISNSGKTCYAVDLKSPAGLRCLEDLVRGSDVLVENLKPGSLAALGLSVARLSELNPRLVYCSITGFGNDSAYPGRPAFDTVVQAMSGIMDANAVDGMPLKAGVSVCDVMGGEMALFAVMAALFDRETSGTGAVVDLSMQDIALWVTARLWKKNSPEGDYGHMIRCRDGYLLAQNDLKPDAPVVASLDRETAASILRAAGNLCVPVRSIREALDSEDGKTLKPLDVQVAAGGEYLPLLGPPLAMSPITLRRGMPPGKPIRLDRDLAAE